MMIFQLLLLLLYAVGDFVCGLPITSTPLESNPDHLAWDALLSIDTRYPSDHEEVRKIPKSIFITPNLNESNKTCKQGYKMGADGKCYKTNNFNIDPLDILKTQIESLFNANKEKPTTNIEYEEYDYDSYDATDSNEPYHVPLSLSFAADEQQQQPPQNSVTEKKPSEQQNLPFRGEETVGSSNANSGKVTSHKSEQQFFLGGNSDTNTVIDKIGNGATRTETDGTTNKYQGTKNGQIIASNVQDDSAVGSLHGKGPYQFLALSAIHDAKTEKGHQSNRPIDIMSSTSTESPFEIMTMSNGIMMPMNQKMHSEKMELFNEKTEPHHYADGSTTATDGSIVTTTTLDASTEMIDADIAATATIHNNVNNDDDEKKFQIELQGESLFEDDSNGNVSSSTIMGNDNDNTQTTIIADDTTTEFIDNIEEPTIAAAAQLLHDNGGGNSDDVHDKNDAIKLTASKTATKPKNNHKMHLEMETIVVVPTTTKKNEQVQIVTPVQNNDLIITTNPPLTTTIHDHASTSTLLSSSSTTTNTNAMTTNNNREGAGDLLNIENESDLNKKLRESIIKHELNEDAIETIDQHNRFVYNHLGTTSHKMAVTTTTTTALPPTPQPTSTLRNLLEHLRLISKYTESNQKHHNDRTKVKFPESNQSSSQFPMNIQQHTRGGSNSNPIDHQRVVKFPGPVSQRNPVPNRNRLIPEQQMSKKPSDPQPPEKPTYSWPPRGWTFDRSPAVSNSRPVLMRFWNKMPLIRDPSYSDVSERSRENSKSPTDSLFEEVPVSDVYKVLSSKNYRHNNR